MKLNDLHQLRSADVGIADITADGDTHTFIALTLGAEASGAAIVLPEVFMSVPAARTLALQLLDAADRAEGKAGTQSAN